MAQDSETHINGGWASARPPVLLTERIAMAKKKNGPGRPTVKSPRISVGFTLKPSVVAKLKRIANKRGVTRSALVEQILVSHLDDWDFKDSRTK